MESETFIRSGEGRRFDFRGDIYTIKRACSEGNAGHSITHAIIRAGSFAPTHTHERYEETFYVLEGELEFTLNQETFQVRAGDYVRAAPGVRHGYANKSERQAQMLFEFAPAGMEEFLYEFRTDEKPFDGAAFIRKAREVHGTTYELPGNAQAN
jgi:quercetin dioxygenase-like cupin family protein